jgi:hypothetical protein
MGKKVTVQWKVDRVYSPSTIGLEKDERHLLVVSVPPGALASGEMKKGDPFTATGVIRNFDRSALEREYGTMDLGNAPLNKFENKPVLVVGGQKSAQLQPRQKSVVERQKPSEAERSTQATAPSEQTLPRTASPLPAIALAGLLALIAGLSIPLLHRQ